MSDQLKNRIVGTLVLTALAVIFLPNLLDGEKTRVEENFATIPLRPAQLPEPVPEQAFTAIQEDDNHSLEPKPKADVAQTQPAKPAEQTAKVAAEKVKPQTKPEPKPQPLKQGWTLQVGTFKNADNVTKLVASLREQGFRAYTIPAKPKQGQLNRVFVGPDISKAKLQKEQQRLAKTNKLNASLVRYKATDI